MRKLFIVCVLSLFTFSLFSQDITGEWNGAANIVGNSLRIVFNIEKEGESFKATMDSPDQGAKGIPVTNVDYQEPVLNIEIANINFKYTGTLKSDTLIEGSFTQMGNTYPLNLKKGGVIINRPQEPKKPYPYISEDVKFRNENADITLAGTLTYPKEGSNFPAVVLISGSGAQNRDEELMGHKPFLVLSDYLTRNGIAVLRFDDRGFAESEGDFSQATTADFATDAYAAVRYLSKVRKEIDPKKIGIIGHSEGGIIAFMLGAEHKDIAYLVSMAGPAVAGDSVLVMQSRSLLQSSGLSKEMIEQNATTMGKIIDITKNHPREFIKENLDSLITAVLPQENSWLHTDDTKRNIAQSFYQFSSPWGQFFITHNPIVDIRKTKCPVLAINGEKDVQVEANVHITTMEKGLKEAGNKNFKTKIYPDLNHLFQNSNTGQMTEYVIIEETMSEEVLNDITTWILEITK